MMNFCSQNFAKYNFAKYTMMSANFAKYTMDVQQGTGSRVRMHPANQLRDTLPNLFLCQTIQQMTTGWYKWLLLV